MRTRRQFEPRNRREKRKNDVRRAGIRIQDVDAFVYPIDLADSAQVTGVLPAANIGDHASSHEDGGSDEVDITALGGYPGGSTDFLREDGTWTAPPGGTFRPTIVYEGNTAMLSFSAITLGAASTLAMWLYCTKANTNFNSIWSKDASNEMYYGDGGGGVTTKFTIVKAGSAIYRSTSAVTINAWKLVVVVDTGSAIQVYIDNVDVGPNLIGGYTSLNGFAPTRLVQGINSNNFNGYQTEAAIWSRALNSTERGELWNGGNGLYGDTGISPFNSGLVAGWHLDEGIGGQALDFSGNGHTATLSSLLQWSATRNFINP